MYVVLHVYFYVEDDVHPGTPQHPDEKTSLALLVAVLHILLASVCKESLVSQRSLVAGDLAHITVKSPFYSKGGYKSIGEKLLR